MRNQPNERLEIAQGTLRQIKLHQPTNPQTAAADFVACISTRQAETMTLDLDAVHVDSAQPLPPIRISCSVSPSCAQAIRFLLSFEDGYFVKQVSTGLSTNKARSRMCDLLFDALLLKMDSSHQKKEWKRFKAELQSLDAEQDTGATTETAGGQIVPNAEDEFQAPLVDDVDSNELFNGLPRLANQLLQRGQDFFSSRIHGIKKKPSARIPDDLNRALLKSLSNAADKHTAKEVEILSGLGVGEVNSGTSSWKRALSELMVWYVKTGNIRRVGANRFWLDGSPSPVFQAAPYRSYRRIPVPLANIRLQFLRNKRIIPYQALIVRNKAVTLNRFADGTGANTNLPALMVVAAKINCSMGASVQSIEVRQACADKPPDVEWKPPNEVRRSRRRKRHQFTWLKKRANWKPLGRRPLVPVPFNEVRDHMVSYDCAAGGRSVILLHPSGNHQLFIPMIDQPVGVTEDMREDSPATVPAQGPALATVPTQGPAPATVAQLAIGEPVPRSNFGDPSDPLYCKIFLSHEN